MPDRKWHPIEQVLTRVFWRFYNRSWLDAVTGGPQNFGVPGLIPKSKRVEQAFGRLTSDFIGLNYYTKAYVQWRPRSAAPERPSALPLGVTFARRKEIVSDLEWALHPKGFAKMLKIVSRYGLPIYVTENGIADQKDELRPSYLISHLQEVAKAREAGLDIRGYFHWSLLDNFEWVKGFGPRFGLYRVNFETFERSPTRSALILKKLIESHSEDPAGKAGPLRKILEKPIYSGWLESLTKS